jgi:hypothetical protein
MEFGVSVVTFLDADLTQTFILVISKVVTTTSFTPLQKVKGACNTISIVNRLE